MNAPRNWPGAEPPQSRTEPPHHAAIDFTWGLRVPMRDGVELSATLYRPKGSDPAPAIFTMTPYIADSYHERATYFARQGYAFVLVDCRGRGNSNGRFEPFVHDSQDGHDVVLWLAQQSWCSGDVSMWGGSYGGFNQWMTLKSFPAPLRTIVPVASAHATVDFPFVKNIFYPYEMQWLTFTSGVTNNDGIFGDKEFWQEKYCELYTSQRPFREYDQIVGNLDTVFQTWVQHPTPDAYWQGLVLTPQEYRQIDRPILTITGHYDGDQLGAMHFYREHMRYGSAEDIANHYLIIGPWDHAGTRTPKKAFSGLEFGDASLLDMNQLHLQWYNWTLRDGPRPEFLQKRVAYYVAGAEKWRHVDSLEAVATDTRRFYLDSEGGAANDVFRSGQLRGEPPQASAPDSYVYDPLDNRPAASQREFITDYLTNQRYALELFGNGLVYHSEPFATAVEFSGFPRLVLWLALDVPDTDFHAVLYEITRDGRSIQLADDLLRARYRLSLTEETLITPGEINRYEFDRFPFFSRQIAAGSRLRLLVKSPGNIYFQKNFNGGGVVSEESGADARTAHVTLYHDADYRSYLELPFVAAEQETAASGE